MSEQIVAKNYRLNRHPLTERQAVDLDYDSAIEIVGPFRPHQGQGSHKKATRRFVKSVTSVQPAPFRTRKWTDLP